MILQFSPVLTAILLVYSGLSLVFGIWTCLGLSRHRQTPSSQKSRWLLGVCSDFSHYVGIPVGIVRIYAILFSPFVIGILFYVLYYWVIQSRRQTPVIPAEPAPSSKELQVTQMQELQVTQMQSRYYSRRSL